jgi:4-hydroxy-3-polyprenylbenzoate decarboxylase
MSKKPAIIIGLSGASGIVYGIRLLEVLQPLPITTHLVMSQAAAITLSYESSWSVKDVCALADIVHPMKNIAASIASGSFVTQGMIIAPCSIRTLSEIATGATSSLLTRAADVVLKERRKLVLMVRETPLHTGHLRAMTAVSEMGGIIAPPLPSFYDQPQTIDDMVNQIVGRVLSMFDIDTGLVKPWEG